MGRLAGCEAGVSAALARDKNWLASVNAVHRAANHKQPRKGAVFAPRRARKTTSVRGLVDMAPTGIGLGYEALFRCLTLHGACEQGELGLTDRQDNLGPAESAHGVAIEVLRIEGLFPIAFNENGRKWAQGNGMKAFGSASGEGLPPIVGEL